MRVLLVYPQFPTTYGGFQHSLGIIGKRATLPPLGLISVAALLPPDWDLRLVDMNVRSLGDDDMRWADVVLTGGMLVQEPSMHQIIEEAHRFGLRTIVGGPACTTSPERFDDADFLFLGEAEGRFPALISAIEGRPETPRVVAGRATLTARRPNPTIRSARRPALSLHVHSDVTWMSI
jgi:radical SAM superfamily enzyme YgiQ (UPF0313 family)